MFIAALFIVAKTWKQPKCSSTEDWIKMWYIYIYTYTMEYYSAIRKSEIMPFTARWIDLEIIILSEVSQIEKEKYHMTSIICEIEKEMVQYRVSGPVVENPPAKAGNRGQSPDQGDFTCCGTAKPGPHD